MSKPTKLKKILFLCVGNTCRSQMAEGFANKHGEGKIEVQTAGTSAAGLVNQDSIDAMKEIGIDISNQTSDQLTDHMFDWADVVITMGCMPARLVCPPDYPGIKRDWPIKDPLGMPWDFMCMVRDDIEQRVLNLIEELTA